MKVKKQTSKNVKQIAKQRRDQQIKLEKVLKLKNKHRAVLKTIYCSFFGQTRTGFTKGARICSLN